MRRTSLCTILLFIFLLSCSTTSIFSSSSLTHTPGRGTIPTGYRDTPEESESLSPFATETMIPWALTSTASALFAGTPTQKTTIDLPITQQFGELSYYLKDVDFVSESTGWAVGEPHWDQALRKYVGTIIKTTDGGATWTPQDAGQVGTLRNVDFVDENNGWAVGTGGAILHTSDGGVHWALQSIDSQDEFRGVAFVSSTEGWVSGSHGTKHDDYHNVDVNWKGSIWHTADGGETWQQQQVPESASLLTRMKFINAQEGWVVGVKDTGRTLGSEPIHAGEVYHTRDGGATWEELYSPGEDISLTSIEWVGQNDGWVAGFPTNSSLPDGYVFHTADGGKTWKKQSPGSFGDNLWDIQFVDANRGYVIGTYYNSSMSFMVSRTVDGGQTWAEVKTGHTENEGGYALSIVGDKAVLVGDNDIIARSDNAWDTLDCGDFICLFTQSYLNPHYKFHDVFFTDEKNGWAVGSKNYSPGTWGKVIMHTADGGETWLAQYEMQEQSKIIFYDRLESVDFVDNQNGWAVGTSSDGKHNAIIHTADGGQTWSEQGQELYATWDLEFSSVQFFNLKDGWALATKKFPSENMFLARTNDGGQHWAWVDTGLEGDLQIGFGSVQSMLSFPDAQHGWAAGGRYELMATSDGGATWSRQKLTCKRSELCDPRIYAVSFFDNQNGWVVGENLFHTTNGGQTWIPFDLFPEGSNAREAEAYGEVQDLHFFNPQTGIVATDTGLVLYSSDGGARWMLVGNENYYPLLGLHCPSAQKCWIVGEGGTILSVELPS